MTAETSQADDCLLNGELVGFGRPNDGGEVAVARVTR
jgi:hypothetical protein